MRNLKEISEKWMLKYKKQWKHSYMQLAIALEESKKKIIEKDMATHSSILAWEIPWTEEPGGLQSMGSSGVRHNWVTKQQQQLEVVKTTILQIDF